ncbi:MAG: GIY-YIG nuclease family protein [Chlorobiaceae bacterium]|nr:GIY-YIG nuclease family protein [Chlorobiaceae bacterium]
MHSRLFTRFGNQGPGGSYILVITLSSPVSLAFGRFRNGAPLFLDRGEYLYIGSALGGTRSHSPLAARLIRHASRSRGQKPHLIREALIDLFPDYEDKVKKSQGIVQKKLRWHIDYLLDLPEAEIRHMVIINSPKRLERELWKLLGPLEGISVPARRLGAQDTRECTHLLMTENLEQVLGTIRKSVPAMISS